MRSSRPSSTPRAAAISRPTPSNSLTSSRRRRKVPDGITRTIVTLRRCLMRSSASPSICNGMCGRSPGKWISAFVGQSAGRTTVGHHVDVCLNLFFEGFVDHLRRTRPPQNAVDSLPERVRNQERQVRGDFAAAGLLKTGHRGDPAVPIDLLTFQTPHTPLDHDGWFLMTAGISNVKRCFCEENFCSPSPGKTISTPEESWISSGSAQYTCTWRCGLRGSSSPAPKRTCRLRCIRSPSAAHSDTWCRSPRAR